MLTHSTLGFVFDNVAGIWFSTCRISNRAVVEMFPKKVFQKWLLAIFPLKFLERRQKDIYSRSYLKMSPVSRVFHTVVTVDKNHQIFPD